MTTLTSHDSPLMYMIVYAVFSVGFPEKNYEEAEINSVFTFCLPYEADLSTIVGI